ncbi:MAG TPA: phenylalanine--tRNA ligase beta subunit-related protein [Burkholderiaceae bacterium]|nr:phenylalanine--tRNA ligase beta subunit-related protein [Burkholderiaceae bacterium]
MQFSHSSALWSAFPELVAGVVRADGIHDRVAVTDALARHTALALARLEGRTESDLPAIQAWRRTFQRMGLKPTQYRCASEALLRRLRKERELPHLHPLVDLCNAISVAHAIPVAALDLAQVQGNLQVRHADGSEDYLSFGGEHETPQPGEVVFIDDAGRAHARRWTNRQSALSAIGPQSARVLIVAEALHERAADDVRELLATLERELQAIWGVPTRSAMLSRDAPAFDL